MFRDDTERYMLCDDPELDIETDELLNKSAEERREYLLLLFRTIHQLMSEDPDSVTLRTNVSLEDFREALERLWHAPAEKSKNKFLACADDGKRNVLMPKSPAHSAHMVVAEHAMWRMVTKHGDLQKDIRAAAQGETNPKKKSELFNRLMDLLDPRNTSKEQYRENHEWALPMIYSYLQTQYNLRSAFPPFHAKFLAETYLPTDASCIVVDPCAGWSGRLIGTMSVKRGTPIKYRGVDPNERMRYAYSKAQQWSVFDTFIRLLDSGVAERVIDGRVIEHTKSLYENSVDENAKFIWRPPMTEEDMSRQWVERTAFQARRARVDQAPFEQWILSESARALMGTVDLVMTSPPYFNAEIYNTGVEQSANNYTTYDTWHEKFYRPLIQGAWDLLRPNGVLVLNVANVDDAPMLEQDAATLAREAGFVHEADFRLAMPMTVGTRKKKSPAAGNSKTRKGHQLFIDGKPFKYEPVFVFRKPRAAAHSRN